MYSQNSTVVSSSEFDDHFKKAIVENNIVSRQIISAFMGFNNVEDFWGYRERINSSFSQLLNKYDLKKLSHAQWISLISNQKKSVTLLNNNIQPFAVTLNGGAISADKCHEVYNSCIDKAIASYAEAQVVCIAFGALGFTLVGGALFTLCEGAAYYSLNVSKKSCATDFRFCNVQ